MREAHRHLILRAVVVQQRLETRLGSADRQPVARLLHRLEDVLYEVAADVEALSFRVGRGRERSRWRWCA